MKSVTLNTGKKMPIIGLGTWKSKTGEVTQAVKDAIELGYRHIDCARAYANETEVGAALRAKMEDGTIKREELFITSKLWNTFHSKELVKTCLQKSLQDLGLAYLDLYLIHWPMGYKEGGDMFPKDDAGTTLYSDVDFVESWLVMEECVKEGLVRAIGVSNFNKDQIERIIAAGSIVPAVNQVECHPHLAQVKLMEYCKSKGVALTAYSPLGSPDRPWVKPDDPVLMENPKITAIATKYSKTPAQILIAFQTQRGNICTPKSVTKSRIESNMKVFDFELSSDDIKLIESFDCNGRICGLEWAKDHKYYPFSTAF